LATGDPILTSILKVGKLPVQSTFWRFVNALHLNVARQTLTIMRTMRERVWAAAHVELEAVTIDTEVHTLYGRQMGGRKSYNPKNKGKKSYQPMSFIAESREYSWGELRNGDRPSGQIGDHLRYVQGSDFLCGVVLQPSGCAENLIKEANNDAELARTPRAASMWTAFIASWRCWPTT